MYNNNFPSSEKNANNNARVMISKRVLKTATHTGVSNILVTALAIMKTVKVLL